jgi:hypothetical protein
MVESNSIELASDIKAFVLKYLGLDLRAPRVWGRSIAVDRRKGWSVKVNPIFLKVKSNLRILTCFGETLVKWSKPSYFLRFFAYGTKFCNIPS